VNVPKRKKLYKVNGDNRQTLFKPNSEYMVNRFRRTNEEKDMVSKCVSTNQNTKDMHPKSVQTMRSTYKDILTGHVF